jgi:hypothetical protein
LKLERQPDFERYVSYMKAELKKYTFMSSLGREKPCDYLRWITP